MAINCRCRMSSDDRHNSLSSCQVYIARLFCPRWAPQGGLRGWVTSFCAEYVGHAPATRAYKCTARSSRKPCSSFMVLVFSGNAVDYSPGGVRRGRRCSCNLTAGIFMTTHLTAQLKQFSNSPDEAEMRGSFERMRPRSPIVTYTIISAGIHRHTKVLPGR